MAEDPTDEATRLRARLAVLDDAAPPKRRSPLPAILTVAAALALLAGVLVATWHRSAREKPTSPDVTQASAHSNDELMKSSARAVCATQETARNLLSVVVRSAHPGGDDAKAAQAYLDQIAAQTQVGIDAASVVGINPAAARVSCVATVSFHWPAAIMAKVDPRDAGAQSLAVVMRYTVQPAPSGTGLVYGIDSVKRGGEFLGVPGLVTLIQRFADDALEADRKRPAPGSPS